MKVCTRVLMTSLLLILPVVGHSEIGTWEQTTKRICHIVDMVQPGSFHYFDCLSIFEHAPANSQTVLYATVRACIAPSVHHPQKCLQSVQNEAADMAELSGLSAILDNCQTCSSDDQLVRECYIGQLF